MGVSGECSIFWADLQWFHLKSEILTIRILTRFTWHDHHILWATPKTIYSWCDQLEQQCIYLCAHLNLHLAASSIGKTVCFCTAWPQLVSGHWWEITKLIQNTTSRCQGFNSRIFWLYRYFSSPNKTPAFVGVQKTSLFRTLKCKM